MITGAPRKVPPLDVLPRTREGAIAAGVRWYFTGESCSKGHLDARTVGQYRCVQCMRDRTKDRWQSDPDYRKLQLDLSKRAWEQMSSEERLAKSQRQEATRRRSETQMLRKKETVRIRAQRSEVREARRKRDRDYYNAVLKNDPVYKENMKDRGARYAKENKPVVNEKSGRRRAMRVLGTPVWLTDHQKAETLWLYTWAAVLSRFTGISHVVDHIVPLQGVLVCGLHVPWNLQVLTRTENILKANKFDVS